MIGEYREWAQQITHTIAQLEARLDRLERLASALLAEGRRVRRATAVAVGALAGAVAAAAFAALTWWRLRRDDRR